MKAKLVFKDKLKVSDRCFAELVIWQVPTALKGSFHDYKYRLAFVVDEVCVLRYDNEVGKGDHKHIGNREYEYAFTTLKALREDFLADVERLKK